MGHALRVVLLLLAMTVLQLLLLSIFPHGPGDHPVQWSFQAVTDGPGPVRVELMATIEEGWYMYATELPSDDGPLPTVIRILPADHFVLQGPVEGPEPKEQYDPNFGMVVRYHSGSPVFTQYILPSATGDLWLEGEVEFMCCNDKTCLPPRVVPFRLALKGKPANDR